MSIEVIKPGALSTFQDLGRKGYQRFGVQVGGAMDERAHRLANMLVGNSATQATLEITLLGPALKFHTAAMIAVCGADLAPALDGVRIATGRRVGVPAGGMLTFGSRNSGLRAYLAVHGGYVLPRIMGSLSTNVRAGFGGMGGSALRKGAVIELHSPLMADAESPVIAPEYPPGVVRAGDTAIRIVPGREWEFFSASAHRALLTELYRIGAQSDRIGYRLSGATLPLSTSNEFLSETVGFGTVQVPSDGQPIILMADHGTTGGYPKIAHVVSVDLARLAQMMPGETIHFELLELAQAQHLAVAQSRVFASMDAACNGGHLEKVA